MGSTLKVFESPIVFSAKLAEGEHGIQITPLISLIFLIFLI
jgi:hypothetical protein